MEFPTRGILVVFEGPDRSGKSTQIKLCTDALERTGRVVSRMAFPERSSATGILIDKILKDKNGPRLPARALHLLFSANRWEKEEEIKRRLSAGEIVLVDRYCHSGLVYSCASGLDPEWCKSADRGLPRPDLVLYLETKVEKISNRADFGNEIFETENFQNRVKYFYEQCLSCENFCKTIDAGRDRETIASECVSEILKTENLSSKSLIKLMM